MGQTALQPREPQPAAAQALREVARPPGSATFQPSRELLRAWLLLLLDEQATHGYELRRLLDAHGVRPETGAMYRTLRKLEDEGRAASRWQDSDAGPRRRLYEITPKGRHDLQDLVGAIKATRDVHSAFLQVHEAHETSPAR